MGDPCFHDVHSLSVGDNVIITGPTTCVIEMVIKELRVDDISVEKVEKGINFSTPIDQIIRPSDKLYKVIEAE